MEASAERKRILEEVKLIPENKLAEIYSILHHFRIGLETTRNGMKPVMKYAGCWSDMSDQVFTEFTQEIAARRENAFSRRRTGEAGAN
jgi:hypothetical protein